MVSLILGCSAVERCDQWPVVRTGFKPLRSECLLFCHLLRNLFQKLWAKIGQHAVDDIGN